MGDSSDVLIAGGGLAGLTLAIQLRQTVPDLGVTVVEKRAGPPPITTHSVGESVVEIGGLYLSRTLGLDEELAAELPKHGLRFFFPSGDNTEIARRLEVGPSVGAVAPSFHLDRGTFERALARRAEVLGVRFVRGGTVRDVSLGDPHRVVVEGRTPQEHRARWVIDASGRARWLGRRLGLHQDSDHTAHAAWFRIDRAIEPDTWSTDPAWSGRNQVPRRLTTNHFMGPGYWVWLIPLPGDRTSVGIVVDGTVHAFDAIATPAAAWRWLEAHEPQVAAVIEGDFAERLDFRPLKAYSHAASRVLSPERWAIVGEAGLFADPFYSPGTDFIGMLNTYVATAIARERAGEDVTGLVRRFNVHARRVFWGFMDVYRHQYPMFGAGPVMAAKIVWDFASYWAVNGHSFATGGLYDPAWMAEAGPKLARYGRTSTAVQHMLRDWAARRPGGGEAGFVDIAGFEVLMELNEALVVPDRRIAPLEAHLTTLDHLAGELAHLASADGVATPVAPKTPNRLAALVDVL